MLILFTAGCQAPGFFAANLLPRAKIKAVYKPIDQRTLVFVDDKRRAVHSGQLASVIAERTARDLKEQGAIRDFVPVEELDTLRAGASDFDKLPIDEIGRRTGAKQVLYVIIDSFDPGGASQELQRPMASARLKVVDVSVGRLFPLQGEHGVTSTLSFKQPALDAASRGRDTLVARALAERLGEDIARQFYDHPQREVGSGFED